MIPFDTYGSPDHPTLVCIPGLLGGPSDFAGFLKEWSERFHVIVLDPDRERFRSGPRALTPSEMEAGLYNSSAATIVQALNHLKIHAVYLAGYSLGGKTIYEFASLFPKRFLRGVVMDVSPGPLENTELFRFVDSLVRSLDLNLPFAKMKEHLREAIPDRNLRSMIQTQIFYPGGKPPARWKPGINNFGRYFVADLRAQNIDEQFDGLKRVDDYLAARGRFIHVLRASHLSGVCSRALEQIESLRALRIQVAEGARHFMHVTHKGLVTQAVLRLHPGHGAEFGPELVYIRESKWHSAALTSPCGK